MKLFTKGDKVVVVAVLLLTITTYIVFATFVSNEKPDLLQIFVDGDLYASYSLEEIRNEKKIEISSAYGKNTLKLTSEGAEMIDSTCPDKTDVRCGRISKSGQVIICAPNRVLIKLLGNDNKIDKVTY